MNFDLEDLIIDRYVGDRDDDVVQVPLAPRDPMPGQSLLRYIDPTTPHSKPLIQRCLEMTSAFETSRKPPLCYGRVTGNFDGQGISYGALQWNVGTGTFAKLMLSLEKKYPGVIVEVMGAFGKDMLVWLAGSKDSQMVWATSFQKNNQVFGEEAGLFEKLGLRKEMIEAQTAAAFGYFNKAVKMFKEFGLKTERAVALFFDIAVQNGSIKPSTKAKILAEIASFPRIPETVWYEVEAMKVVATMRAYDCKKEFVQDVLARKLFIANGFGKVHGKNYSTDEDFNAKTEDFQVRMCEVML